MESTTRSRRDRRRRRRLLAVLISVMAVGTATTTALSLALFTAQTAVGANFTTGTIVIATNPATTVFNVPAMMPGDTVNASLQVQNTGTAQFRYAMAGVSTNADTRNLRDQITLTVKEQGTSCAAFDGTTVYSGALAGAAIGDPATGAQAGDRTLNGGANETLCFRASLPLGTGNTFQGAATVTTFTFSAEQTANN